ncbi:MAG: hypothetical protein J0L47_06670 [Flavobacteriales bacterium]|nr:hypothetical protein [Flavobacteriales bacterium]MCA0391980.1 hypothetical protein [Bacteroidota bacterium]
MLTLLILLQSCIDCKRSSKYISQDEFNIVVEVPPSEYSDLFKTRGYDPITMKTIIYEDGNRWLDFYKKEVEKGDTIVKLKGDFIFYIHKADTVIAHEWVCYDGKGRHVYSNDK